MDNFIVVYVAGRRRLVNTDFIKFISLNGSQTHIYFIDREHIVVDNTFSDMELKILGAERNGSPITKSVL